MRLKLPSDFPVHLKHGIKMGLAVVLANFVALACGLTMPYLAVITAVIVSHLYLADSLRMSIHRVIGTLIGAGLGILVVLLNQGSDLYTYIGLFLAVCLCGVLVTSKPQFRMAAVTVGTVAVVGGAATNQLHYAFERVGEIFIGVLAALLVSLLVWPLKAGEKLAALAADFRAEAAERLVEISDHFTGGPRPFDPARLARLDTLYRQTRDFLGKALSQEAWVAPARTERRLDDLGVMERIADAVHALARTLTEERGEQVDWIITPELNALVAAAAAALTDAGGARSAGLRTDLARTLAAFEERLTELRLCGITRRLSLGRLQQFFAFAEALRGLARSLAAQLETARPDGDSPQSA